MLRGHLEVPGPSGRKGRSFPDSSSGTVQPPASGEAGDGGDLGP